MEAGQHSQVLYSMFRFAAAPGPAFRRWNECANPLIALEFGRYALKLIPRRTKQSGV
jgi:hypothetical protein